MTFSDTYPSHRKRSLLSVGKQDENFNEHFSQDLPMSTPHMERNNYNYIHPSVLKKKKDPSSTIFKMYFNEMIHYIS